MTNTSQLNADDRADLRHSADTDEVLSRATWSGPTVTWWDLGAPIAEAHGCADAWARVRELELARDTQATRFVARVLERAWPSWPAGEVALDLRSLDVALSSALMTSLARELWRRIRARALSGAIVLARPDQRWIVELLLNDYGVAA